MNPEVDQIRQRILDLVEEYYASAYRPQKFTPGITPVPVSGRVFDAADMRSLVDSGLDFWLTTGRFADLFERRFAEFFGLRYAVLVNSGSSANLLALTCLTSTSLRDQRLMVGDEVITTATGFPTTVNPIFQNGLVPVFVDVEIPTYNIDVSQLETALSPRTRAVMIAHTLGNPFDLKSVVEFTRRNNLWLIEDCCDAVGSTFSDRLVGTFGDLSTASFYPAHHITMGEGGCIMTNRSALKKLVESFRDWGRNCWCDPGQDNTCGKRYHWQLGELPRGYDHKYIYSHIGYNLKATDMQASVGVSQLQKLPRFIQVRRENFAYLYQHLKMLEEFFILPQATPGSNPSWFGFPLFVRANAPFNRQELLRHLEKNKIGTRLIFGGNLVRQPAYLEKKYRVVSDLIHSDEVMRRAFWIGVYPGLTQPMLDYVIETIVDFCSHT